MSTSTSTVTTPVEALAIAHADASRVYRDANKFRVIIKREPDGWHVDYELGNPTLCGGGPHYVIHTENGDILYKRYDQ